MLKRFSIIAICSTIMIFTFNSCDVLQEVVNTNTVPSNALTNDQVVGGLKEALKQGVTKGVNTLSVKDGYFKNPSIKILFLEKQVQQQKEG